MNLISTVETPNEQDLIETVHHLLGGMGYAVERETYVHPYLDERADIVARHPAKPTIIVEVKVLPSTAAITVDTVQQLQHMAHLLTQQTGEEVVGLLLTTGAISPIASRYATSSSPSIYLATTADMDDAITRASSSATMAK